MTPDVLLLRWQAIEAELTALRELKTLSTDPATREGELLEAVDEIEFLLGQAYLTGDLDELG